MGGLEYDDTMTPYECRMGWAVDLAKHDFHGKAALLEARGRAQVTVVSMTIPEPGQYDGAALTLRGQNAGHISMAVPCPYLGGQVLGLARVRKDLATPGAQFEVGADKTITATIVATPVYDPERIRARS